MNNEISIGSDVIITDKSVSSFAKGIELSNVSLKSEISKLHNLTLTSIASNFKNRLSILNVNDDTLMNNKYFNVEVPSQFKEYCSFLKKTEFINVETSELVLKKFIINENGLESELPCKFQGNIDMYGPINIKDRICVHNEPLICKAGMISCNDTVLKDVQIDHNLEWNEASGRKLQLHELLINQILSNASISFLNELNIDTGHFKDVIINELSGSKVSVSNIIVRDNLISNHISCIECISSNISTVECKTNSIDTTFIDTSNIKFIFGSGDQLKAEYTEVNDSFINNLTSKNIHVDNNYTTNIFTSNAFMSNLECQYINSSEIDVQRLNVSNFVINELVGLENVQADKAEFKMIISYSNELNNINASFISSSNINSDFLQSPNIVTKNLISSNLNVDVITSEELESLNISSCNIQVDNLLVDQDAVFNTNINVNNDINGDRLYCQDAQFLNTLSVNNVNVSGTFTFNGDQAIFGKKFAYLCVEFCIKVMHTHLWPFQFKNSFLILRKERVQRRC
jgi:hypothetical protein